MKISLNWLKDFVDINENAEEVAAALVASGIEVASIQKKQVPLGVVAGRVTTVGKHPNADKLVLCKVDVGAGEPLMIVCGAPNVRPDMFVACATIGTVISPEFIIKETKIRGMQSSGMLCSERELGISDNHDGIMDLPSGTVPGTSLKELYPDDAVFELEITPDRGDCLSVLGIAREISARFCRPLKNPGLVPQESAGAIDDQIKVVIEEKDADACPRYMGRLITGVTIAESPQWMKNRLRAAGLRPINNVVDVTNYIMIAWGQPMHSFDYDRIEGKTIVVRRGSDGQKFHTLDNVERSLSSGDLLICDGARPVALAGVMGGAGSEISGSTTSVFLECAYFDPAGVRLTSKRLGLSTDSSYRFERGVDPLAGLETALDTAAELIRTLGNGAVVHGRIDENPKKTEQKTIVVRPERIAAVLGASISADAVASYLEGLGMPCEGRTERTLTIHVPAFRHDIEQEIDLVEEVGRLYGYDNIPVREESRVSIDRKPQTAEFKNDTVRRSLAYGGFNEIVTNSMTSQKLNDLCTPGVAQVALLNPLSPDMARMRTTLLPGMLQVAAYNVNRKNQNNRLFEVGTIFRSRGPDLLPEERTVVGILLEGDYYAAAWSHATVPSSFYIIKGILDNCALYWKTGRFEYANSFPASPFFEEEFACVSAPGIAGALGRVAARITAAFDIKNKAYYAQLDITDFLGSDIIALRYRHLPKYPALERDFCFVMAEEILSSSITQEMLLQSDLVESVVPFDVYRGEKLGAGLKSIACSVRLRSPDRTLTDKEAEAVCAKIIAVMKSKYNAVLRQ